MDQTPIQLKNILADTYSLSTHVYDWTRPKTLGEICGLQQKAECWKTGNLLHRNNDNVWEVMYSNSVHGGGSFKLSNFLCI